MELPLTAENVESVLDEVRPYLIADGGNVALHEIDGNVVRLKLQGACGSCPSSVMTMKMGIEQRLIEKIPEIVAAYSSHRNWKNLTKHGDDNKQLALIHGLKSLSMIWIITGHVTFFAMASLKNLPVILTFMDKIIYQPVLASQTSVDANNPVLRRFIANTVSDM